MEHEVWNGQNEPGKEIWQQQENKERCQKMEQTIRCQIEKIRADEWGLSLATFLDDMEVLLKEWLRLGGISGQGGQELAGELYRLAGELQRREMDFCKAKGRWLEERLKAWGMERGEPPAAEPQLDEQSMRRLLQDDPQGVEQGRPLAAEPQLGEQSVRRLLQDDPQEDRYYSVTLSQKGCRVPPFCSCCGRPTENQEELYTAVKRGILRYSATTRMPQCPECRAHQKQIQKLASRLVWISVGLSAAAALVVSWLFGNPLWLLLPVLLCPLCFLLMAYLMPAPALGPEHSAMEYSAWIDLDPNSGQLTYNFARQGYARLFARLNNAQVREHTTDISVRASFLGALGNVGGRVLTLFFCGMGIWMILTFGALVLAPRLAGDISGDSVSTGGYAEEWSDSMAQQRAEILQMEEELESLADDIQYYEDQYYATGLEKYAREHDLQVEEYNELWEKYDQAVDDYNLQVDAYNNAR